MKLLTMLSGVFKHGLLPVQTVFFPLVILFSAHTVSAAPELSPQTTILSVTVSQGSSIEDLIVSSGYSLAPEKIEAFLTEFSNLNPNINKYSSLPAGIVVKLPATYLMKNILIKPPVTVSQGSSIEDLIVASGYSLAPEKVEAFLAEFSNLNPNINKFSSLPAGVVVKLPAAYLTQNNLAKPPVMESSSVKNVVVTSEAVPPSERQVEGSEFITTKKNVIVATEAGTPSEQQADNSADTKLTEKTEKYYMGRFSDMDTAKIFLKRIVESGYTGGIEQKQGISGKTEYNVYALLPMSSWNADDSESRSWSLLGQRGRNIHAAITLTGIFTDIAFKSKQNRESDFSLFLTPEIWLNFPRSDKTFVNNTLSPSAAGGQLLDTVLSERLFGYQASLNYRTELPLISSKALSGSASPTHRLAAGLNIVGNRFSLRLSDQLELSHQERQTGQVLRPDVRNRNDSNRFSAGLTYNTGNRLILSLDYINFITRSSDEKGEDLNRRDFGLVPAVRYRLSNRINLLAEYRYYVISYDKNSSLDSREHYIMGGMEWRLSEKSFGRVMAGHQLKEFGLGGQSKGLSFELQLDHKLGPKTQLSLSAFRKTGETRLKDSAFMLSTGASLALSHMLNSRISANAFLSYANNRYGGISSLSLPRTATDNIFQAGIGVHYAFRRWLRADANYIFSLNNSSDPSSDYYSNTLVFSLTGTY